MKNQKKKKEKKVSTEEKSEQSDEARFAQAKNEKVRDLLQKNHIFEQKKKEIETQKKEAEQFNNQDQYVKFAKM